jgi:hypothetical protein
VISRTSLVVMEARLLAVISFLAWIHWRPMADDLTPFAVE